VLESKDVNQGYDAATGEYTDMIKAGIIDPLKARAGGRGGRETGDLNCSITAASSRPSLLLLLLLLHESTTMLLLLQGDFRVCCCCCCKGI
jgi:hypothetical protein